MFVDCRRLGGGEGGRKWKKKQRKKRKDKEICEKLYLHLHLSLNWGDRLGTTDDFTTCFLNFSPPSGWLGSKHQLINPPPFLSVLHCPLGLSELQACPFLDAVFPPLFLPVLSSSPFHCPLQDGFGQTWWTGDTEPLTQANDLYGSRRKSKVNIFCLEAFIEAFFPPNKHDSQRN